METNKYIAVVDENLVTEKQPGQVQIQTHGNNIKPRLVQSIIFHSYIN